MSKKLIFLLCALLIVAFAGCALIQVTDAIPIPKEIPANASVNTSWNGDMCEASGFVYYVSDSDSKAKIVRMNQDGSNPTPVTTGEYKYIHELTSDGAYLYFVSSAGPIELEMDKIDTIYRLPLSGGSEQEVTQGYVFGLQTAKGKLYWAEDHTQSGVTSRKINCVNSDGSDLQSILSVPPGSTDSLDFLIAGENIYYTTGLIDTNNNYSISDDIFRMGLDGRNIVKLNSGKLDAVCALYFDQGKLYFLMERFNGDPAVGSSLEELDEKGTAIKLVDQVGYYSQDYYTNAFCGITNNVFYYFSLQHTDVNADHIYMDFHQFDLATKKDIVLLHHIEMGYPAVGTLTSVRGKSIGNNGVSGLYILGNDIYFSPDTWRKNP
jgi:hypothetical protein